MKAEDLKKKYLQFFKSKKHAIIPGSSLIPQNDPTVLFTTAGMHPLVPFLLGEKHPSGKRLVDVQKCIRTGDIEEVGDDVHLSFFEMLGNWSLGDYFKEEAIKFSFEFLTEVLKIPVYKLAVTVFGGDKRFSQIPKDEESAKVWQEIGIPKEKIVFLKGGVLESDNNWWGPAGQTGPCGPCTEMFYYIGSKVPEKFDPKNAKWVEIWNDVFMQYNKTEKGKYEPLKQQNVDTGMGLERTAAVLQGKSSVFDIETFKPIIYEIKKLSKKRNVRSERIIADHLRAAVFILEEGIAPSNLEQGYVLRKFIRRSLRHLRLLGVDLFKGDYTVDIAKVICEIYGNKNQKFIFSELKKEEDKFQKSLDRGLREFEKMLSDDKIDGGEAFLLYQSYGFPIEMIVELAKEHKVKIDVKGFEKELEKHQELSRKSTVGKFKSGLADKSVETARLHTATHLLHAALREVLGKHVFQRGSNITSERLRFDFSHGKKMTDVEIKKVENLVNKKIKEELVISKKEMKTSDALKEGAIGVFGGRYGAKVSVYSVGKFDKEICAGPHVNNTKELGKFKIIKEESVAAGVRRIKAVLVKS